MFRFDCASQRIHRRWLGNGAIDFGPRSRKRLADEHRLDARFIVRNEANHAYDNRLWRYVALGVSSFVSA